MALWPLVSGAVGTLVEAWLTDDIPRPGLPTSENLERLKHIIIGILCGFAVGYMFYLAGVQEALKAKRGQTWREHTA